MRAMESLEKISRSALNDMQGRQNDGSYLSAFDAWISAAKSPANRAPRAVEELSNYAAIIKLFWSSLPGTFRGYFIIKNKKRGYGDDFEGLWFYNYWDGQRSSQRGTFQRDRLVAIVLGTAEIATRFKEICDRLLLFDLSQSQEVAYAQTKDIQRSSFWMREDPKMLARNEQSLRKRA